MDRIKIIFFFIYKYDTLKIVKNKVLLVLGMVIVATIVVVVVILNKTLNEQPVNKPAMESEETAKTVIVEPSPTPKLETWKDEAGFIFQYPSDLKLTQNTQDNNSYANVEIKSVSEPGTISIMAVDTRYNNIEAWVKYEDSIKGGNIIETTLGDKPAKKILVNNKIMVAAIDDQILFSLKGDQANSEYWQKVFKQIHDSWEFFYPTPIPKPTSKVSKNTQAAPTDDLGILEEMGE
jgi:hypothetical protein